MTCEFCTHEAYWEVHWRDRAGKANEVRCCGLHADTVRGFFKREPVGQEVEASIRWYRVGELVMEVSR